MLTTHLLHLPNEVLCLIFQWLHIEHHVIHLPQMCTRLQSLLSESHSLALPPILDLTRIRWKGSNPDQPRDMMLHAWARQKIGPLILRLRTINVPPTLALQTWPSCTQLEIFEQPRAKGHSLSERAAFSHVTHLTIHCTSNAMLEGVLKRVPHLTQLSIVQQDTCADTQHLLEDVEIWTADMPLKEVVYQPRHIEMGDVLVLQHWLTKVDRLTLDLKEASACAWDIRRFTAMCGIALARLRRGSVEHMSVCISRDLLFATFRRKCAQFMQ